MSDVVVHLALAPTIVTKFVAVMQLVFGFGITALILRRIGRWLNEYWLILLLLLGTLMIGSAVAWVMLPLIGVLLDGVEAITALPFVSIVVSVAGSFGAFRALTHALSEWLKQKAVDKVEVTLADKATELYLRYI